MVPIFDMGPRMFAMATGGLLVFILLFFVITGLLMWLWNITMPEIFRLPEINFWQAFRLLIIAAILFGGLNLTTS